MVPPDSGRDVAFCGVPSVIYAVKLRIPSTTSVTRASHRWLRSRGTVSLQFQWYVLEEAPESILIKSLPQTNSSEGFFPLIWTPIDRVIILADNILPMYRRTSGGDTAANNAFSALPTTGLSVIALFSPSFQYQKHDLPPSSHCMHVSCESIISRPRPAIVECRWYHLHAPWQDAEWSVSDKARAKEGDHNWIHSASEQSLLVAA
ncbi:hypothetical protein IW261DRAFT_816168 [Armillaria novae-zelandiae]|uniref:Uncharacterized protein n=1 Tax=Armillaria novae-zelandiae TaxID=153914 RepID=A0AA39NUT3_9AGAR|nr:hypothetical protein IW261DRAFT_816168 [Armillaria novae-zelandiae]